VFLCVCVFVFFVIVVVLFLVFSFVLLFVLLRFVGVSHWFFDLICVLCEFLFVLVVCFVVLCLS